MAVAPFTSPSSPTQFTLREAGRRAFAPVDRRPIWQWAEEHVSLGSNYTITGKFRLDRSPYLRDPFDSLQADHVRIVCLRAPVRSGKTLFADVLLLWIIANDPGPTMVNYQTDAMAKDMAKTRTRHNLDLCPAIAPLLPADRHDRNICEIHFAHGMPLWIQGPSESNLQSKGIRYLINDEPWLWQPGRIYQAYARTKDFDRMGNSKTLNISQGGIEGDDEDTEWGKGDQREWHVHCLNPQCGQCFLPALEFNQTNSDGKTIGFAFDDSDVMLDEHGDWRVAEAIKTIRHICPHCGHVSPDSNATRSAWNAAGKFVPRNPKAPPHRVSFHFESSVVGPWSAILEGYLYALNALRRGVVDPIRIWTQKERALPWSELLLFTAKPSRTFDVSAEEWKEEHVRFFTLDFQDEDVWWGMICAWSRRGEARRLWFGRLTSESDILKLQAEWKVKPAHVGMDCGYKTKRVYAMCARNGWIAFRGDSRPEFSARERTAGGGWLNFRRSWEWYSGDPEIGTVHAGRRFAYVVRWSNPTLKDRLSQLIARGLWITPKPDHPHDEAELEYKRQMSAEYKKQKRNPVTGQVQMIWVCPSGHNHLFDCASEQVVFATIKRILPDIEREPAAASAPAEASGGDSDRLSGLSL